MIALVTFSRFTSYFSRYVVTFSRSEFLIIKNHDRRHSRLLSYTAYTYTIIILYDIIETENRYHSFRKSLLFIPKIAIIETDFDIIETEPIFIEIIFQIFTYN